MSGAVLKQRTPSVPRVAEGTCLMLYAFDVGQEVHLDRCRARLAFEASTRPLPTRRGSQSYFAYEPAPIRVSQGSLSIPVAGEKVEVSVELSIFDFGAMSVLYRFPFAGDLARMLPVAVALSEGAGLEEDARSRVSQLVFRLEDGIDRPHIDSLVEDYFILHAARFEEPLTATELLKRHGPLVAQALRFEPHPLSRQEVRSALREHISYGPDDLVVVDWGGAFIYDRDCDDTIDVLVYANMQLIELRWLDRNLDRAVTEALDALEVEYRGARRLLRPYAEPMRTVSRYQLESSVIFERIENTLKLFGDQYLARVCQLAATRFYLSRWQGEVVRKLELLGEVYSRMNDRAEALRSEVLEWIIIWLIVFEIALSLWPGH